MRRLAALFLFAALTCFSGASILFFLQSAALADKTSPVTAPVTGGLAVLAGQAEQGDARAEDHLGWAYHQGIGVPADDAQALRWLHKGARKGNADAEYHLGMLYEWAQGTTLNFPEARKWFRKSADQGNVPAQMALADMYAQGWGGRLDKGEAYFWYLVAARSGAPVALEQRDALQRQLEAARLPGILKRAVAWHPAPLENPPPRIRRRGRHAPGRVAKAGREPISR